MIKFRPAGRFTRGLVFLATAWTVTSWIFLIDNNLFSQRERFQESDFIMTFYVAGRLVLEDRSDELYPSPEANSFIDSPFDKAAHEFLPHLPKATNGAYMYTPLVAGFFAPFSLAGPNLSLLIWQALSVLALAFSCRIMAQMTEAKASDMFFLSSLYAPVLLTLWTGQLGLGFGLAPLCAGYYLLLRRWPLAAGFVWSLLLLKPQYFLAAAFVALLLALNGRYRTLAGMTGGVILLVGLTVLVFSPELTTQWLLSHRVSDATYSSGLHLIPTHLITGLPANVMILFPPGARAALKWPLYGASAALWLIGLWSGVKLARAKLPETTWMPLAFIIGVALCAVTLPHLLYYDLCVLIPAGALLLGKGEPLRAQKYFRSIGLAGWIVVTAFLPLLLAFTAQKLLPLALELILLTLLVGYWHQLRQLLKPRRL